MSVERIPSIRKGAGLSHIQRKTLPHEVAERLRQLILDGHFEPGQRIQETTLSEQLGVSRTPLREAFKVLATEGFLELLPHRGAVIASLDAEDLDHMFTVLGALEGLAGELACTNISEQELDEIRNLHESMFKCYKQRRRAEYFRINRLIHEKIIAAAANPVLSNIYANLSGRIRRARYTPNVSDATWAQAAQDHEMILDALMARNPNRLHAILRQHLAHKKDGVKAALYPERNEDRLAAVAP